MENEKKKTLTDLIISLAHKDINFDFDERYANRDDIRLCVNVDPDYPKEDSRILVYFLNPNDKNGRGFSLIGDIYSVTEGNIRDLVDEGYYVTLNRKHLMPGDEVRLVYNYDYDSDYYDSDYDEEDYDYYDDDEDEDEGEDEEMQKQ